MATQPANIADILVTTLPQFRKFRFTDMTSNYQKTVAFKNVYNKHKTKNDDGDGTSIKYNLMVDTNGSFRFVGLAFEAQTSMPSVFVQAEVPLRQWTYNWSVDGMEPAMQGSATKIFDILKSRYFAAVGAMIKGTERALWRAAGVSSDDVFGIPNFVVKSNTAATLANNDGFNGNVPSGWSTVAGVTPSTQGNNRWYNYATQYTAVSKEDLVRKARRMSEKIDFMPLVDDMPLLKAGGGYGHYMNYSTYEPMVELAESQNDNLGADIASMDGNKLMFKRARLDWIPELEYDSTNPWYMIDWDTIYAARLKGWWEREIKIDVNPIQPTVATVHRVTRTNLICTDRRKNGVIATDTTMPS